jgi:hypothetical protein
MKKYLIERDGQVLITDIMTAEKNDRVIATLQMFAGKWRIVGVSK